MANRALSVLAHVLPGVRQWTVAHNLLSGGSPVSSSASSGFSDILNGLSDHYLGTHYGQSELQEQQQGFNAAQAQLNRDWQFQMMQYQNEYNSPSAMMQRFRDAGLNPSLMLSGSAPAIESASPSGGGAAVSGLGSSSNSALSPADLLGAQVANINADTDLKRGKTRSLEISNSVDGMNAEAYKVFFSQNENDIIRVMSQQLGIQSNEFVLSNYETFEAAWNFAIQFGMSLSDAFKTGQLSYGGDFSTVLDDMDLSSVEDMFKKASALFIGGRDAEIAANEAVRVMNQAQSLKSQKDYDIWKFLVDTSKNGDKWERIGAQVALTALFISGERFNIQMPSFRIHSFRKVDKSNHTSDITIRSKNSFVE